MRHDVNKMMALTGPQGFERIVAFFRGRGFTQHRHDTYGIGITTFGAQCFGYRGASYRCVPGQAFILHPDELHDGHEGDERGFGYRIAYVDPALISEAAGTSRPPFVAEPVSDDPRLRAAIDRLLSGADDAVDELDLVSRLSDFACLLAGVTDTREARRAIDTRAVGLARAFLLDAHSDRVPVAELERVSGLSRWQLARDFRSAYSVNPSRFQLLRRLDAARALIRSGEALAEAAHAAGFADQPHFTRHFRAAFGLTPGAWRQLCLK